MLRRLAAIAVPLLAGCTSVAPASATFEGTSWQVTALNGHATPAAPNYRMVFRTKRLTGQFGCNHFGGTYRLRADTLITDAVAITEMACRDPADTFEGWGLAVLQQPMRISWTSGRQLALSNAAGSIALERAP
jgi:heat shock protein HslJ